MPMVTRGVTRISILVSLETAFPNSAAMIATKRTAKGPPAPPSALAANPTVAMEKRTSGGHFSAYPMATAMAGPLMAEAIPPTVYSTPPIVAIGCIRKPMCSWVPKVLMIVPISREQNRPWAIAPSASIP